MIALFYLETIVHGSFFYSYIFSKKKTNTVSPKIKKEIGKKRLKNFENIKADGFFSYIYIQFKLLRLLMEKNYIVIPATYNKSPLFII